VALKKVDGVTDAEVSYPAGRATVAYNPALVKPAEFIAELERMTGYQAAVIDDADAPLATMPTGDTVTEMDSAAHDHDGHAHEEAGGRPPTGSARR